ncbi:sugar ABC transporter substrate-binding protein [Agromyces kandeliae]|uniref:Substrate-binding domain-containing protein n=1 Tax=Agromyces kandeliae TaxID=2666141 RepID=A0A6L5R2U8_9MICO|nr:sugar ABC transporter substrate-binding protein [Agromyces kandeliae]MRX44396.1 substrate-binding domain-containing protein [Agromyces kandeliae]
MKHFSGLSSALAVSATVLLLAGCATAANSSAEPPAAGGSGDRYTQDDVTTATGIHDVTSVFSVPKSLPEDLNLAYINPSLGTPFFKSMSDGYKAAAEFYGVDIHEADLGNFNFADAVNKYDTISVFQPEVVGILTPSGAGLVDRTRADGVKLLASGIPIEGADGFIGTPERETGMLAGSVLAEGVAPLVDDEWADQEVVFVGLGQAAIPTTMERVESGLEGFEAGGVEPDSAEFPDLGKSATVADGVRVMADFLTAHPEQAIAVVAMNDQAGVGALQAVQAAGRQDDVRIVTIGADEVGRAAFKSDDGIILGEVDLNPWGAGWRWVEAALALALDEEFVIPAPERVITRDNVDELYPED